MRWRSQGRRTGRAEQEPIDENIIPGSDRLFVFFGGIAGEIGALPPFEFYRAAGILDASKIFIRDVRQVWYQAGLPGIGRDPRAIGKYLETKIAESGASEVRFVGNSMGGYAALLFAGMLRKGTAIAFVPQVFLDAETRARHGDLRWPHHIANMYRVRPRSEAYDLRSWLAARYPEISADVYVSRLHALDVSHAEMLREFANVRIHEVAEGEPHGVVKWLRDQGRLAAILAR